MRRKLLLGLALLVIGLLLWPFLPQRLALILTRLPYGWVRFLGRTLPEVTLNWAGMGMVVVCSVLVFVGGHWLLRRLFQAAWGGAGEEGRGPRWLWRWTLALYAGFWLLFAIVMASAGVFRQVTWLFETREPFYSERTNPWAEMKIATVEVALALLDSDRDPATTRRAIFSGQAESPRTRPKSWEQYHLLFFGERDGMIRAVAIVPRDPEAARRVGFVVISREAMQEDHPIDELPEVIARYSRGE